MVTFAAGVKPASGSRGTEPLSERRHSRQSVGENDGKRGLKGYDGYKRLQGRKHHLLVDTLSMVLEVELSAASERDVQGGAQVLLRAQARYPRLKTIWADLGYKGLFPAWVWHRLGIAVNLTSKPGFGEKPRLLRPKRWIVERTFAWLGRSRRLSKDYEYLVETSRAMIYLAMTRLMLRRLVQGTPP